MTTTIDDVCEKLDSLFLRSLELMDEKIVLTLQLENQMRDGHIELAKARYIRGKESVGILQVPQDSTINSLFNLETIFNEENTNQSIATPHFDISMKSNENGNDNYDPIRWFGVLVPQSLKTAQKRFQESIYLSTKIANIDSELESIPKEFEDSKNLKSSLINVEE
ncbi:coiled-coil domain-containing protein 115 [Microplitis demolitor]|uniref:coiled-coil domain-containing protein 115 n=1 Tax=Microplitis demolitor TaxID=69319 RepID=UPI0004CCF989|nr:coiled-coil domain-containing protein 115 [Microplitis demolitor]XP_053597167.1 coiled-coil domain-containing protein 115 [Microplitis demolitor]